MIIQAEEREEGKLYRQSVEGFTELTPEEYADYNARLAAHLAEQLTNEGE